MLISKKSFVLSAVVVSGLIAAGCGSSSKSAGNAASSGTSAGSSATSAGSSSSNKSPIVLGVNDSLTGPAAVEGQGDLAFIKGVVAYENSIGGIDGRQLKVVSYDSGNIGSGQAATNVVELSQQHAAVIFGPTVSNDCDSAIAVADQKEIPEVCGNGDKSLLPDNPYMFVGSEYEPTWAPAVLQFIKMITHTTDPSVAYVTGDTQGSDDLATKLKNIAGAEGVKIAYVGINPATATSFSPQIAGTIAAHPDALLMYQYPNYDASIVSGVRGGLGNIPIVSTLGVVGYQTLQTLHDPNLYGFGGAQLIVPGASTNSAELNQIIHYLQSNGSPTAVQLNLNVPDNLAADLDVMSALRACRGCSGSQLAHQMENTSLTIGGLVSNFHYTATDHQGVTQDYFYKWNTTTNAPQLVTTEPLGSMSLAQP
jgi:ABC-type branched-subunit amino acid transport system substrate-binding protein